MFGSLCYRHLSGERSKKLNDKSEPMIYKVSRNKCLYTIQSSETQITVSIDVIVYG